MTFLAVTLPPFPFSEYGSTLLSFTASEISAVLPYGAATTAVAIGVAMVKRWLGHRRATSLGASSGEKGEHPEWCTCPDCVHEPEHF
jgi:hypothetical protein